MGDRLLASWPGYSSNFTRHGTDVKRAQVPKINAAPRHCEVHSEPMDLAMWVNTLPKNVCTNLWLSRKDSNLLPADHKASEPTIVLDQSFLAHWHIACMNINIQGTQLTMVIIVTDWWWDINHEAVGRKLIWNFGKQHFVEADIEVYVMYLYM